MPAVAKKRIAHAAAVVKSQQTGTQQQNKTHRKAPFVRKQVSDGGGTKLQTTPNSSKRQTRTEDEVRAVVAELKRTKSHVEKTIQAVVERKFSRAAGSDTYRQIWDTVDAAKASVATKQLADDVALELRKRLPLVKKFKLVAQASVFKDGDQDVCAAESKRWDTAVCASFSATAEAEGFVCLFLVYLVPFIYEGQEALNDSRDQSYLEVASSSDSDSSSSSSSSSSESSDSEEEEVKPREEKSSINSNSSLLDTTRSPAKVAKTSTKSSVSSTKTDTSTNSSATSSSSSGASGTTTSSSSKSRKASSSSTSSSLSSSSSSANSSSSSSSSSSVSPPKVHNKRVR